MQGEALPTAEELLPGLPQIIDGMLRNDEEMASNIHKLWKAMADVTLHVTLHVTQTLRLQKERIEDLEKEIITLKQKAEEFVTPRLN